MKKKLTLTALLGVLALACLGTGCKELTTLEKKEKEGYKISVSYDANGGLFLSLEGVIVMDMFDPSKYEKDGNGTVHIKLLEPTAPSRPSTVPGESISLSMQDHFFAGWYQNREVKTIDGKPVDEEGKELTLLDDGTYVYTETLDEERPTKATPAYNYSGYWDFENDTIQYTEGVDDKISLTLYAGWVPFYEFNYYYQVEGEWEKLDTITTFDYKTTNSVETESDQDTIFLPQWVDGAMNYEHTYLNSSTQKFPAIDGTTFEKAYTDADCTQEITESLEHSGSLVLAHGEEKSLLVENRVQNVYIIVSEGEQYYINTAEQFIKHANLNGHYEIAADLDFNNLVWPTTFSNGEFKGKIYGKGGAAINFSNINLNYSISGAKYGGLFGRISRVASMQGITFNNVTVDLINTGNRNNEASYGLFAGEIETGATLDVSIKNATLKIGAIGKAESLSFHTVANGDRTGIDADTIGLIVYGVWLYEDEVEGNVYKYTIQPETVKIEKNGSITFEFYPSSHKLNKENYIIKENVEE